MSKSKCAGYVHACNGLQAPCTPGCDAAEVLALRHLPAHTHAAAVNVIFTPASGGGGIAGPEYHSIRQGIEGTHAVQEACVQVERAGQQVGGGGACSWRRAVVLSPLAGLCCQAPSCQGCSSTRQGRKGWQGA